MDSSRRTMAFIPTNQPATGQMYGKNSPRSIIGPGQILGIIGGGNMGQSIAFPLFDAGLINPGCVIVSATSEGTLEPWKSYGCRVTVRNEVVLRESTIVIWAVKPLVFPTVVDLLTKDLAGKPLKDGALHISIMAGIPLDRFTDKIKRGFTITGSTSHVYGFKSIRVMPNVGLRVATGVVVFAAASNATELDKDLMFSMFQPLGLCYEVPEYQINAYCALFGSGIGFMFPIVEALSDGAVKMGIPRATSLEIAAQVLKGAGELVLKERTHPGALKDMVCSPGGTTIAGIAELEKGGIRSVIMNAIEAATLRGEEMATIGQRTT